MTKYNANNERIKRKYLTFLKQAKGQNEASIDAVAKALVRFESYNKHKDFRAFHFEQAIGFKKYLANQLHYKTGKPLSLATLNSTVRYLKTFIEWLSQEVGYKSRIKYSDAEYFNLSEKETRIAKSSRQKPVASVHRYHPLLYLLKQFKRIFPRQDRITGIVVYTEMRRLNPIHQLAKDIHLLSELRIRPVIILVVILYDQRDSSFGRMRNTGLDTLRCIGHPIFARYVWATLPRQYTTVIAA